MMSEKSEFMIEIWHGDSSVYGFPLRLSLLLYLHLELYLKLFKPNIKFALLSKLTTVYSGQLQQDQFK